MPAKPIKTVQDIRLEKDQQRLLEGQYDGLTEKKLKFVQEYVKDLDATAAWIRAGYGEKTKGRAYSLLSETAVESAVQKLLVERRAKEKLSSALVIKAFLRIAHAAESEGNWANALRAWENLARYLGMFVERSETALTVEERTNGQSLEEMTSSIKRLFSQQVTKNVAEKKNV